MSGYEQADYWAKKAKAEGYPARSVYKLAEIDEKFGVVKPGARVLDLGAAPGSWALWLLRRLGAKGFVVACDLSPLAIGEGRENLRFVRGDLYAPENRAAIAALGPYDAVVSDAAPATTGNRTVDTARSEAIVEAALSYADDMLAPGGAFVAKLFQGGAERELLALLRERFSVARAFKPKACRAESFETFLVGLGKKG